MTAIETGISQAQCLSNILVKLIALRNALRDTKDLYAWSSAIAPADMATATGYTTADATALQTAIADAHALALYYDTGIPPGTYPQPASGYAYGASQRLVINSQ